MERSAEEIQQHNVSVMGDALGVVYSELWQELGRLFSDWGEFVSLFGTNPERIDLLNNSAAHFFRTIQDSLWERTLLKIARITDPAKTGKRHNLSLASLAAAITDPALKNAVEFSISDTLEKCAFARDWRNRHIAHADMELALDATTQPLATASRQNVKEALLSIQDVLNAVSIPLLESTTRFDEMTLLNSGEDLIFLLDFALRKKAEQRKRIESGNYTDDDLAELRPRSV